ncbi:archaemetzincin [Desulfocicer vacuolatum DSM 3385]|uniref:Archaemetzincin n=1 Tax=Desulfocicer vacuolatum DSM 3385 TaxID=1121400 RepID=A0A1W2CKK6_9BACT|nr:archaemetzincin [Desulfocicer vacuolatum DSM 3385]
MAAANIQAVFDIATDVAAPWPAPRGAVFSHRSQYNAAEIIKSLAVNIHGPVKRVGITSRDITLPFLTYVFGEARIGGNAAVISTHRLQLPCNGIIPEKSLVYTRLSKIAIHETGHLMGLSHCKSSRCIMNFSVGLDKLDTLSPVLCNECKVRLNAITKR